MIYLVETQHNIDRLVQDSSNRSALGMELLQSCTKPSMYVSLKMRHKVDVPGTFVLMLTIVDKHRMSYGWAMLPY